jgi:hypothetical protein
MFMIASSDGDMLLFDSGTDGTKVTSDAAGTESFPLSEGMISVTHEMADRRVTTKHGNLLMARHIQIRS